MSFLYAAFLTNGKNGGIKVILPLIVPVQLYLSTTSPNVQDTPVTRNPKTHVVRAQVANEQGGTVIYLNTSQIRYKKYGYTCYTEWGHMFWVHLLNWEHFKQDNMEIGSTCYLTSRSIGATNAQTT